MVLASRNRGKISEMHQMLNPLGIELQTALDYPQLADIKETGSTLKENALIKARTAFYITGHPSLADDSGLEVDALDGRPGVHSARYAGPGADDIKNIDKLLEELSLCRGPENRKARFRTVLAYVDSEGSRIFEGRCEGHIASVGKGRSGFGYDPVFVPDGHAITFAEMDAEEKNRISHRGQAMAAFREFIRGI
ncbi:MAG: RdgB/HAM1 family non-canonical purine NTP pyrophosphatase [Balneolales bacterium]